MFKRRMDRVLLYNQEKKRWEMTRVDAYKRHKNTIDPLEKLLKEMEY